MEAIVFIISLLISLIFFIAGLAKLFKSYESLNERMQWTNEKSVIFIRFIALAEIIGAIGFIVPYYINIIPFVSNISALGLVVIMIGAPITHVKLGEHKEAAFTTLMLILLLVISFIRIFG